MGPAPFAEWESARRRVMPYCRSRRVESCATNPEENMALSAPFPRLEPQPSLKDFFQGFVLPFQALQLIFRERRLRRASWLCAAVTLLCFIGLGVGLYRVSPLLLSWVWEPPVQTWWALWLWKATAVLVFLTLFFVGAQILPLVLLSPLLDWISEATETVCGPLPSAATGWVALSRGLWRSLTHTLGRLFFLLLGYALLLPLHLIPGAGSVAWSFLSGSWTLLFLTAEHLGTPMARHLYSFGQVRKALQARWALALGFGLSVSLLLWVPLLNILLLPAAAVAGTLLFRALLEAKAVPLPPQQPGIGSNATSH